jgi:hypothetical protein
MIHLTVYRGAQHTDPIARDEVSWDGLCTEIEALCTDEDPATDKRDLIAFGPYLLKEGASRSAADVEVMSDVAMLDVDACDLPALRERIAQIRCEAIVHGTPSDDPDAPVRKVRIYARLDGEHAPDEAGEVRDSVAAILGVAHDPATRNADRIGFVGRLAGTPPRYVERFHGAPIARAQLPSVTPGAAVTPSSALARQPLPEPSISRPSAAYDAASMGIIGALGSAENHRGDAGGGGLHNVSGAIGGLLRKCGWSRDQCEALMRAWLDGASDSVEARVRWACDAWRKPSSEVSGMQALAAFVGGDVSAAIEQCAMLPWRARQGPGIVQPQHDERVEDDDEGSYPTLKRVDLTVNPDPMRYVIPGLEIAPGKVTALQGFANAGKTPFALLMATCVAAGCKFLGMRTTQTNVAYFDHESSPLTQERAIRIRHGLGLEDSPPGLHLFNAQPFSAELIRDARQAIDDHTIGMLVVDTYSSALPADDSASFNDSSFRSWATTLGRLSSETGVLVMILLHETKAAGGAEGIRGISGHGSLAGALQTAIALAHPSEDNVARVRVSCARATRKGFRTFDIVWSDADNPDAPEGEALIATREKLPDKPVDTATAKDARDAAATRAAGEALLLAMPRGQAVSTATLMTMGGESRSACQRALARLLRAGLVIYVHPGRYQITDAGAEADAHARATALGAIGGFQT